MSEPNIIDRLELTIIKHEMDLRNVRIELQNENLTSGQTRALHVEIEKIIFSLKTLKFIKK